MSQAGSILLRIFTGPHAGAEILLGSGPCLLGSQEDCDLILRDSSVAPHHVRLTVLPPLLRMGSAQDQPPPLPQVRLAALDGSVDMQAAPEPAQPDNAMQNSDSPGAAPFPETLAMHGDIFPSGVPCFLGLTSIAWAIPQEAAAVWEQVLRQLAPMLHPGTQQHGSHGAVDDTAAPPPAPNADQPSATAETTPSPKAHAAAPGPTPGTTQPTHVPGNANTVGTRLLALSWPKALLRWLPLLLTGILLAALSVNAGRRMQLAAPSAEELRALLNAQGFEELEVVSGKEGLLVRGCLDDDARRGLLVRVVQSLQYPVRLDVCMDMDAAHALAAAFASRNLFPEVTRNVKNGALQVRGYIKDSIVEDWAFAGARDDLPALGRHEETMSRHILHAEAVDAVLRPSLAHAGLQNMGVRYLPGSVEISGQLDVERRKALEKALAEVRKELDIPLKVDVHEKAPDLHAQPAPAATKAPAAPAAPSRGLMPAFSVTSVTVHPLRFITLANGERVFEGGQLGGYVLEGISTRQLTLRRNGQSTIYPLRDSHDTAQ